MYESIVIAGIEFELNHQFDRTLLYNTKSSAVNIPLIGQAVHSADIAGIQDVIATETELAIVLSDVNNLSLEKLKNVKLKDFQSIEVRLPILIDENGDWTRIASFSKLSRDEFLDKLNGLSFEVKMHGFQPGFIYMSGLHKILQIPRKEKPSMLKSKNSLAIGGEYIGIYSLPSPAGWNVLGNCPIDILDLNNLPPSLLQVGDRIKFDFVSLSKFNEIIKNDVTLKDYNGWD